MKLWSTRRKVSSSGVAGDSDSDRYGLNTLYEPSSPIVDIVFIHGLSGHRDRTWSAKNGAGPWPKELLAPKLPEARIMLYGYDAHVVKADSLVSNNGIGDHARSLLSALATCRDAEKSASEDLEMYRPLIFVAHSLGGLVCQEALVASRASAENHLRDILRCTWAIAFIGTPHSGVDSADAVDRLARWTAHVRQANPRIVQILRRDSELLARTQNDFHSLLRSQLSEGRREISITCFYEELPVPRFGEIVPKSSAILPSYPSIGIHRNHMDMVKFSTENDPGFISVVGELLRFQVCEWPLRTDRDKGRVRWHNNMW
ncbi:putative SesB-related regulatory protein [Ilyonectria destructans]|nr:putative SesB-related regulatory protein [Ilyonectria destructans]